MNLFLFMTIFTIMSYTGVFGKTEEFVSIQEFEFTGCLNGGILNELVECTCPPQYTGSKCEISLVDLRQFAKKKETTFHHLTKRSLNGGCEYYGSGSGSASGSGMEVAYEETMKCPREKEFVNGKCEFVRVFEGKLIIVNRNFTLEFYNETSEEYKAVSMGIECLINRIYDGVEGYVNSQVRLIKKGSVVVHFVVNLEWSSDITSYELDQIFTTRLQEIRTKFEISEGKIKDKDECYFGHDCDPHRGICNNTDGSYTCTCPFKYTDAAADGERYGSKCRHVCTDQYKGEYCLNGAVCNITVYGAAVCSCPDNYQGVRCEREWIVFLNATVGLGAALGLLFVVFIFVTIMLCARTKLNQGSDFIELESNSQNGEYIPTTANEIKGISNPYVASDEGVTVATNQVDDDPEVPPFEDDKL